MNRETPITPDVVIADASRVTPREFMDAIGLSSPELRAQRDSEMRQQCIAAIKRGDTYGWPPVMVADCKAVMAERDKPELKRTGTGDWL